MASAVIWSVPISMNALIAAALKYAPILEAARMVCAVTCERGPLSGPCSARWMIPAIRATAPTYFAPQSASAASSPVPASDGSTLASIAWIAFCAVSVNV